MQKEPLMSVIYNNSPYTQKFSSTKSIISSTKSIISSEEDVVKISKTMKLMSLENCSTPSKGLEPLEKIRFPNESRVISLIPQKILKNLENITKTIQIPDEITQMKRDIILQKDIIRKSTGHKSKNNKLLSNTEIKKYLSVFGKKGGKSKEENIKILLDSINEYEGILVIRREEIVTETISPVLNVSSLSSKKIGKKIIADF
jgi:hypothetical protein